MKLIDADALIAKMPTVMDMQDTYLPIHFKEWLIDNGPTIEPKQGEWMPCSERLPSEDEQDPELGVIVTLGNGYSGLQYDWYHDGHWYDWDGFVVAWMPLPKPWKGVDDERTQK